MLSLVRSFGAPLTLLLHVLPCFSGLVHAGTLDGESEALVASRAMPAQSASSSHGAALGAVLAQGHGRGGAPTRIISRALFRGSRRPAAVEGSGSAVAAIEGEGGSRARSQPEQRSEKEERRLDSPRYRALRKSGCPAPAVGTRYVVFTDPLQFGCIGAGPGGNRAPHHNVLIGPVVRQPRGGRDWPAIAFAVRAVDGRCHVARVAFDPRAMRNCGYTFMGEARAGLSAERVGASSSPFPPSPFEHRRCSRARERGSD